MLTLSEALPGPREEKHLYVKMLTPLVVSGATPVGVKGWVPPARLGETSDSLENAGDGDRETTGQRSDWDRRVSWEAGSTAVPPSSYEGHRGNQREGQRDDPWTYGEDPWTSGRKDWERQHQGSRDGDDNEWRNWRERNVSQGGATMDGRDGWGARHDPQDLRGHPEADGRDGRPRWHDSARDRGGFASGGGSGYNRGKWEPKAEDLWYTKLEEENHYIGNTKVGEFFSENTFGKSGQAGHGARASERLQVPSFSAEDSEDLGGSARSYLRQIEAWKRMTMLPRTLALHTWCRG